MNNIDINDIVQLNPHAESDLCAWWWNNAGIANNASGTVTNIQNIHGANVATVVVGNNQILIPIRCLIEHHMTGGGKKNRKVKSKRKKRKSKRRKRKSKRKKIYKKKI